MLRIVLHLLVLATLVELTLGLSVSCGQDPLPNPFEPLNKNNTAEVEPTEKSVEPQPAESITSVQSEPQSPIEGQGKGLEAGAIGKNRLDESKDDNESDMPKANPLSQITPPVPIQPQKDLLEVGFQKPYLIEIDAPIDSFFQWYIDKSLEQAKKNGADLVIIKLTSPGGELETSLDLARTIQGIDWAKTVVWIPKEAISGGAIMALGADAIYMQKSALFGDAGPIFMTPWGDLIDAEEKVVSYTAEAIRTIAEESGKPGHVAAAMANRKLKVFAATEKSTGLPTFITETQSNHPDVIANFTIGEAVPEAGNDLFLTVGAQRAKELLLCDEIFESEEALLKKLSDQEPVRIAVTRTDHWVYTLNRPWLTTLILIAGIVCLYIEMTAPGATLPGLIALLCFGLFFWSHILGGTATGLEIMLFLLGTLALFIEIFVLPGFGVFGIAGMAMVGTSLLMATQDFLIPETDFQWQQFKGNGLSILLAGIIVAIMIGVQVFWLDSIPGLSRLQLKPEEAPAPTYTASQHPAASLVLGDRGVSQSDLRPSGKALFKEKLIDVLTEGDYVESGSQVSIVRIEGNFVTVRRVTG